MAEGWDESAQAWIEILGEHGDWGRRYVLDRPMLARLEGGGFRRAVDIGCGEGRFCRMMKALGIDTVGIDPTRALVERACERDPDGDYRVGRAESLDLPDGSCDLAVSYLSLVDIADLDAAVAQAHRVLAPRGTFLVANLQSFNTACPTQGWSHEPDGSRRFCIDHYLEPRTVWVTWRGIRIPNHHRPLEAYMQALLRAGFVLRHFAEPAPIGADDEKADRYRRAPYFLLMEWQKPAAG